MRKYSVCGVGNAIVDVLIQVSESEFAPLGFEKGTMTLVSSADQAALLDRFRTHPSKLISGGSAGNSVFAVSQLGGRSAFIGSIARDSWGAHYRSELVEQGIACSFREHADGVTATSVILITPDAERTMRTHLGVAGSLSPKEINAELIQNSEWLLVEGYLLANAAEGIAAVKRAVALARGAGTKVATMISAKFVVEQARSELTDVLRQSDLVLANIHEAQAYTGQSGVEAAINALQREIPNVVVTRSAEGAHLIYGGESVFIEAFPCRAVDETGAGDLYAGALLYGLSSGHSLAEAGRGAAYLAMKVVTQVGAHLTGDLRGHWAEALKGSAS